MGSAVAGLIWGFALFSNGRRRRAVITGMGVVTPFGIGVRPYWENVLAGTPAISRIDRFDPSGFPCQVAAYLKDHTVSDLHSLFDREPRFVGFALAAARIAAEESRWRGYFNPQRIGVFLGTSGEKFSLNQFAAVAYQARGKNGEVSLQDFTRHWGEKITGGSVTRLFPQCPCHILPAIYTLG